LKVLFPFVGDSVGGSHRSVLGLYDVLKNNNTMSFVFVLHEIGPLSDLLDSLDIKYEYIFTRGLAGESPNLLRITFSIILNFFKLSKFIRKNGIDIVHGNDLRINFTWSLPTRLSGAFYVWHQRSVMSSSVLWNISTILADHFVAISNYVYQSFPSNMPKSKKTLILNPFNTENTYNKKRSRNWINKLYNIPKDDILFGYVGRLTNWKNVDFLIKCFMKYTNKKDSRFHLVIVGAGSGKYVDILKNLAYKLGASDVVTFAGFSFNPNRVISSLDLMIAPSNQEPFGRTLVEAMVQKTPILAARGGGHSEIIDNGITGVLYNHNDIDDFIIQCDKYINDKKFTCQIINNANTIANSKYSAYNHAENIMQIYSRLYVT
jgi:glycosyltransferase involved in cell wall biosynthesis